MNLRTIFAAMAMITGGSLSSSKIPPASGAEAELIALDKAWIDAEVNRDQATLEQILDERFLATFSSGKTIDRTAYIAWIMESEIEPFEVLHDEIRVHGDTALVIDSTLDRLTKLTYVAVKKEGQWRVISQTFTHSAPPE
ncbi:MAG: nuclear transport factor 2 family protein [Opitutaceae bacterium]